jgi:hypothetical protein
MNNHPKLQVWSCGGGTQSCAIGALIIQGKLPKPDVCVIADTGRETRTTWEYLDGVLNPALRSVGLEVIRITAKEWVTGNRQDIYSTYTSRSKTPGEKYLAIPIFSTLTGPVTKMPNFCTNQWKTEPIARWLSNVLGVTRSKLTYWIGFSTDEQRRWAKMMQTDDYKKGLIRFPLLEIGMKRNDSIKLVEDMGWPTPPRSACWMCPNHGDHEWRDIIKNRPDEFAKAVQLEREMREVDPDAWLHRSCVPLDHVDFSQPEDLFSRQCDSGLCFV